MNMSEFVNNVKRVKLDQLREVLKMNPELRDVERLNALCDHLNYELGDALTSLERLFVSAAKVAIDIDISLLSKDHKA
jgi:hypothetical protein